MAVEIPLGNHPAVPDDPRIRAPLRVAAPGRGHPAGHPEGGKGQGQGTGEGSWMARAGRPVAAHYPPQAVIYRYTCCHRNDPAGAPWAHLSCGHASTGWGEAPLVLEP